MTTDTTAIDPALVPAFTLAGGARIPAIGLGTFGSDRFSLEEIAAATGVALRTGYRLIDCASVYANEHLIGPVLAETMADLGLAREDVFVVSKVWNDAHDPAAAVASVHQSLADLKLDYLDALLIHWPFPNTHERYRRSRRPQPDVAALHPCRVHGHVSRPRGAGRRRPDPPPRGLQHDHPEAPAGAARRADRPCPARDGAAPRLPAG